jgi:hypothetical protein
MIITDTGADYEPIPAGVVAAVCIQVFDIGLQRSLDGYPVHQCVVLWELGTAKKNGQPFTITRRYTASLNEMAILRKHLESWRGRAFTADELKRFDTSAIVGKNCRLNLVEKIKTGGKRRVDVESVLPAERGQALKPTTPADFIPEWVAKAIAEQIHPNGEAPAAPVAPAGDFNDDIPF